MLWLIFLAGVLSFESSFIGTFFPGTIFCSQCALLNCPRCAILSPVRYFVPGAIFCSQWAILSNVGYILSPVRYFVPGAIFCSQCAILSSVGYILSPVCFFVPGMQYSVHSVLYSPRYAIYILYCPRYAILSSCAIFGPRCDIYCPEGDVLGMGGCG